MNDVGSGRRIAILIGTNEYSKIEKLEFAENDAKEMGEVLSDPEICGFDEVIELINKNKEEVSKAIEKVFKDAKKDDQVLIYYSGHGKPSYKFDLCLLFKETDPDSLLATSLKYEYINECKGQSACNRVVVILDCCYSGTAGMKGDFLQEALSKFSGSGTILITSTGQTGSNIAKEDKELKHGVFTHYFLKGLKDWTADYDNDGIITVEDLYRYTSNETKTRGLQRPQIKGSYEGEMALGRNPQKIRDKELELKKEKLMRYLSSTPPLVLYKSLTILQKTYNSPSLLEPFEVNVKSHLESLLNDEIQVDAYVDIVKYQEKLERENREQKEQERIQKQREEKLQKEREEGERRKEKEFLERQQQEEQERKYSEEEKARREKEDQEKRRIEEKARKEKEEQEKLRQQKEEAEKLEESKRKTQEEADRRIKEEEEKQQEELFRQREEAEQKRREEERKKEKKEELGRTDFVEAGKAQETKQVLPHPSDKKLQTSAILVGVTLGLIILIILLYPRNLDPTIGSFIASSERVTSGENITLSWNVSNATNVTINPGIGNVPVSGSILVSPSENTTYTLTATNKAGKNATGVLTIYYLKKPKITFFDVNPEKIVFGNNSTLSWIVSGDAHVTITPGIGNVQLIGSEIVSPVENTTYTITATSETGNDSATRIVTVEKRVLPWHPSSSSSKTGREGSTGTETGSTGGGGNTGTETNPTGER